MLGIACPNPTGSLGLWGDHPAQSLWDHPALQGWAPAPGRSRREDGALLAAPVAVGDACLTSLPPLPQGRAAGRPAPHSPGHPGGRLRKSGLPSTIPSHPAHALGRLPPPPPCRGAILIPPSMDREQTSLPPTAIQILLLLSPFVWSRCSDREARTVPIHLGKAGACVWLKARRRCLV